MYEKIYCISARRECERQTDHKDGKYRQEDSQDVKNRKCLRETRLFLK